MIKTNTIKITFIIAAEEAHQTRLQQEIQRSAAEAEEASLRANNVANETVTRLTAELAEERAQHQTERVEEAARAAAEWEERERELQEAARLENNHTVFGDLSGVAQTRTNCNILVSELLRPGRPPGRRRGGRW